MSSISSSPVILGLDPLVKRAVGRISYTTAMTYYVYIITNKPKGTLYIGVTNNLARRLDEHKQHVVAGFSNTYNLDKLVYCEQFENIELAIQHEKRLKRWNRDWKIELIEKSNPDWKDLVSIL